MLTTSDSLILGLKCQDETAWVRFVRLYSPVIYRWCRRRGMQPADAADIGGDIFEAVFHAIGGFQLGAFRAWLRTIAENKIRDFARRRMRRPVAIGGSSAYRRISQIQAIDCDESDGLPDISETSDEVESDSILLYQRASELVCESFPDYYWPVFRRYVVDGVSATEVAREFEINANAVYNVKRRVLRRLKDQFQELID